MQPLYPDPPGGGSSLFGIGSNFEQGDQVSVRELTSPFAKPHATFLFVAKNLRHPLSFLFQILLLLFQGFDVPQNVNLFLGLIQHIRRLGRESLQDVCYTVIPKGAPSWTAAAAAAPLPAAPDMSLRMRQAPLAEVKEAED